MDTVRHPAPARRRNFPQRHAALALAFVAIVWMNLSGAASAGRRSASAAQPSNTARPAAAAKIDPANVTADTISQRLAQLQNATDADVPQRAKIIDLYQQALADLKQADEQTAHGAEFDKQRIAAPYQLDLHKREAATPAPAPTAFPANGHLTEWEQMLTAAEQQLDAAQKDLAAKADDPQRRATRRVEIPQAIAAARMKLDAIEQSAGAATDSDQSAALAEAKRIAREARRRALQAEISALEKELQTYDATSAELAKLEQDAAARKVAQLDQQVDAWRNTVNDRRRTDADRQASDAHWAAITAEPAVRQLADENSALADQHQQLAEKMKQLADDSGTIQQRLDKVKKEFKDVTDRVSAAGLTDAVGQLLRKQRMELTVDADRLAIRRRQDEISQAQLHLFQLEEQMSDLHDVDSRAKQLGANLPRGSRAATDDLRSLLKTRQKYSKELLEDYNAYFSGLVDLDSKQQELLSQSENYRNYIDERVLWIRSTHPLSFGDFGKAREAAAWLGLPSHWWSAVRSAAEHVQANPGLTTLAVVLLVICLAGQRRLHISAIGRAAESGGSAIAQSEQGPLRKTWETSLATLLIVAPWPALLWFVGWLCFPLRGVDQDGFSAALGTALPVTAAVLLPLLLVRNICRSGGLAEAHFGWPAEALVALRRHIGWLLVCGLPMVTAVTMLESQSSDAWKVSLGRWLYGASQLLLSAFFFVVFRPPHGALHRLMLMRQESWTRRLAFPAFMVLVLLPLALGSLAATGYYYTALRLTCRLQATVWLVLGLVLTQASVSRWLRGVYRRLAIKSALRAAHLPVAATKVAPSISAAPAVQTAAPVEPPPEIDLEKVDDQTHRLLHSIAVLGLAVGLCLVWIDVLPALRFFDQVTLWSDATANTNVSLANLLAAGIVAVMTLVAAQNLPGLLEIAVLQMLPLDNGVRYALITVTRYLIIIVGLALGGGAIGIGWPKVQWLAAAVTFGLGFGLQEIFANFISGLIVLFERPIRVGDTVTVGDVTGVVSRIRMRATTIVDGDRKELIVPNKEFITAKLVNWTLSDSVTRLIVRLGIAYGCDTQLVQQLLMRVAGETPGVLKNPPAKAIFMGFSEKWMDFELRVFVGSVDALLSTRHQLNVAIDRTFRSAGVGLALPQCDPRVSPEAASPPSAAQNSESSILQPLTAGKKAA